MTFTAWFQSSDYSSQELGKLDKDAAVKAFLSIDIEHHAQKTTQRMDRGDDFCPFGFGMNGEGGRVLHLFIEDPSQPTFCAHIARDATKRLLGIIPFRGQQEVQLEGISHEQAVKMIDLAYEDFDCLFESARGR